MKHFIILLVLFAMVSCSNNRESRSRLDDKIEEIIKESPIVKESSDESIKVIVETKDSAQGQLEPPTSIITLVDIISLNGTAYVSVIEVGGTHYLVSSGGGIEKLQRQVW